MTSWFMVSPPHGIVISALRDAVIQFWRENEYTREYFWLHRLFAKIVSSNDTAIQKAFEPRTAVTAGPYLCHHLIDPKVPPDLPMLKIKNCNKELREGDALEAAWEYFQEVNRRYAQDQRSVEWSELPELP